MPFLGESPREGEVCRGGDDGTPALIAQPDSVVAQAFREAAREVAANLSVAAIRTDLAPGELLSISRRRSGGTAES